MKRLNILLILTLFLTPFLVGFENFGRSGDGASLGENVFTGPQTINADLTVSGDINIGSATIEQDNETHAPIYSSGLTGLNDVFSSGLYTLSGSAIFQFKIDSTGTPDNFVWRKGIIGVYSAPVAMTGSAQLMQDGISIAWPATTGHTLNDTWEIHVGEEVHIDKTFHAGGDFFVTGDLYVEGSSRSGSPFKLLDGLKFINDITGDPDFHLYVSGSDSAINPLPSAFDGALIFKTHVGDNQYDMDIAFWDAIDDRPTVIINRGAVGRGTVFERGVIIGAQLGAKALDSDYTIGTTTYTNLPFNTSVTGADLGLEGSQQILGSLYVDVIDESATDAGVTIEGVLIKDGVIVDDSAIDNSETGWISGGFLATTSPASANIEISTDMIIRAVDRTNRTLEYTTIPAGTIVPTGMGPGEVKFLFVDMSTGSPVYQWIAYPDGADRRKWAQVGRAWMDGVGNVAGVGDAVDPAWDLGESFKETMYLSSICRVAEGNTYSLHGTNMTLKKTSGSDFKMGAYAKEYIAGTNDSPNQGVEPAVDEFTQLLLVRKDLLTVDYLTEIPTTQYELDGVLTNFSSQNKYGYMLVIHAIKSNLVVLQYGQEEYNSLEAAKAGFNEDDYEYSLGVKNLGPIKGMVAFKNGVTDITSSDIEFVEMNFVPGLGGHEGGVGGVSYWSKSGTDLSPATAGDDILLNTGETLSIADMTTGSIPFIGASGLFSQDNSNLFWDDTNKRLGIGTTDPNTKLSIKGDDDKDTGPIITLSGNAINQVESGRIRFTETDIYYQGGFIYFDGDINTFNIGVHDDADNLTSSDINAISILRSNGNVGVGTIDPDSALHIKANTPGTIGSHPAGQLIIQDPDDTVFGNAVITGYESDVNGNPDQQLWYLGSSSGSNSDITFLNRRNAKLTLGTNSTTRMIIGGDGNVGIGTTSPSGLLEVVSSNTGDNEFYMTNYNDIEPYSNIIYLRKADNVEASPLPVDDNAELGILSFQGYDGDVWVEGANIKVVINGGVAGLDMPADMEFRTNPGDASAVLRWSMTRDGVWQSNGAQTIQTSTGQLDIATAAGNGDIVLTPNGSGVVNIASGVLNIGGSQIDSDNLSDVASIGMLNENETMTQEWYETVTAGITATNPGGQGDSALVSSINEISTVGTTNDAVTLPSAVAGLNVKVINNGANTLEIWPASGDNLGAGVDTATTLASGSNLYLVAYNLISWETF